MPRHRKPIHNTSKPLTYALREAVRESLEGHGSNSFYAIAAEEQARVALESIPVRERARALEIAKTNTRETWDAKDRKRVDQVLRRTLGINYR